MIKEKLEFIINILLISLFIITLLYNGLVFYAIKDMVTMNSMMMFNNKTSFIDGYYNAGEGFYCVQTSLKKSLEINKTAVHEECHVLLSYDKKHFCGE